MLAALERGDADPFALAEWMERPEIRRALAAREHQELASFRTRVLADAKGALDLLKAAMDASRAMATPQQAMEARRSSTAVVRLARIAYAPMPSSAFAGGEPAAAGEVGPPPSRSSPTPPHGPTAPESGQLPTAKSQQPTPPASSVPGGWPGSGRAG